VTGDRISLVSIECTTAGAPLTDCGAAGDVILLDGPVSELPTLQDTSRSVANRTVEVTVKVQEPRQAARFGRKAETYSRMHIYNVGEVMP
jgi:hypothetical protein